MTRDTIGIKRGSVDSFIQNLVDLQQRKNRRGSTDFVKWLFLQQGPSMFNITLFKIQRMVLCLAQSKMQLKSQLGRAQDIPVRIGNSSPNATTKQKDGAQDIPVRIGNSGYICDECSTAYCLGYSCKDWKHPSTGAGIQLRMRLGYSCKDWKHHKIARRITPALAQDIPVRIGNTEQKPKQPTKTKLRIFL